MSDTENEGATRSANEKMENKEKSESEVNEATGDKLKDEEIINLLKEVALDKNKSPPPSPLKSPKKRRRKLKVKEETATIVKNPKFDTKRQAQRLNKALTGISTDERVVNEILTNHTYDQKEKIGKVYKDLYKKELSKELHEELGGFYEDVCQALILNPLKYCAINVNKMISKYEPYIGMEKALIGMFGLRTKQEISDIKGYYKLEVDTDMEEDLLSKLGENNAYRPIIASLLQYSRDPPETPVDEVMANKDADYLNENGLFKGNEHALIDENQTNASAESEKENPVQDESQTNANEDSEKNRTDEHEDDKEAATSDSGVGKDLQDEENRNYSLFHKILVKKTQKQILATLKLYEEMAGNDIKTSLLMEQAPERELNAYSQLIERIKDPPLFFASELDDALQAMESDDDTIVRVMVLRSEVDLKLVDKKYKEAFNKDLNKSLAQATGGDYQKILLKILKPSDAPKVIRVCTYDKH